LHGLNLKALLSVASVDSVNKQGHLMKVARVQRSVEGPLWRLDKERSNSFSYRSPVEYEDQIFIMTSIRMDFLQ
jgi:hypothetical protein